MEDIVGIKVVDKNFGETGFITWGRVFDRVCSKDFLKFVAKNLNKFGIITPDSVTLCDNLQEISDLPYFYEGFFEFTQELIPHGKLYILWRSKKKQAIKKGESIYFLGFKNQEVKK